MVIFTKILSYVRLYITFFAAIDVCDTILIVTTTVYKKFYLKDALPKKYKLYI